MKEIIEDESGENESSQPSFEIRNSNVESFHDWDLMRGSNLIRQSSAYETRTSTTPTELNDD